MMEDVGVWQKIQGPGNKESGCGVCELFLLQVAVSAACLRRARHVLWLVWEWGGCIRLGGSGVVVRARRTREVGRLR